MKTLVLFVLTAVLSTSALAQNATAPAESGNSPGGNMAVPGNRDPGAKQAPLPADNPGTTSVERSATEAPRIGEHTSDRRISREWQGLGSTGGGTGTGTSSGTTADEQAPGQDGNRPAATDNDAAQDASKKIK